MPVTTPRTVTVAPLHAALAPSVWMFVIGVVPSADASHGPAGTVPAHAVPHLVGASACGPVKSATLSSVSWVPLPLRANPLLAVFAVGNASPAPSRKEGCTAVAPTASITVPDALRSCTPPVSTMPVPYVTSPLLAYAPSEFAMTYVRPAGSVVPCGTVARELTAGAAALLEPQSSQPAMSTVADETLRISTASSLALAAPRKATCEMTTDVAACAAGAPTPRTSAAEASARRRDFTMEESFPEGIRETAPHRIGETGGCVTVS